MKTFSSKYGYSFNMKSDYWREINQEERKKYKVSSLQINYLINSQEHGEFSVTFDSFYPFVDTANINNYFKVCKSAMATFGHQVITEDLIKRPNGVIAYKLLTKNPNGKLQLTFFMRLTGQTPKGYGYGCLTTYPTQENDKRENDLLEAISNWNYIDVR